MSLIRLFCVIAFIALSVPVIGQESRFIDSGFVNTFLFSTFKKTDSGVFVTSKYRIGCKGYTETIKFIPQDPPKPALVLVKKASVTSSPVQNRTRFITVHGNIAYDYFYRTNMDNPFNQQAFQQHTERVYLDVLLKERYPLRINFISRQSNSPFFKNFIDVNFSFDKNGYEQKIKQQMINRLKSQMPDYKNYKFADLTLAQAALKKYQSALNKTKGWLEDPAVLQKIVEEKEKLYYQNLSESKPRDIASLKNSSAKENKVADYYQKILTGVGSDGKKLSDEEIEAKVIAYHEQLTHDEDSLSSADSEKILEKKVYEYYQSLANTGDSLTAKNEKSSNVKGFVTAQYNKLRSAKDSAIAMAKQLNVLGEARSFYKKLLSEKDSAKKIVGQNDMEQKVRDYYKQLKNAADSVKNKTSRETESQNAKYFYGTLKSRKDSLLNFHAKTSTQSNENKIDTQTQSIKDSVTTTGFSNTVVKQEKESRTVDSIQHKTSDAAAQLKEYQDSIATKMQRNSFVQNLSQTTQRGEKSVDSLKASIAENETIKKVKSKGSLLQSKLSGLQEKVANPTSLIKNATGAADKKNAANSGSEKLDSAKLTLTNYYESQKKNLDSLNDKVEYYKRRVDSLEQLMQKDLVSLKKKIYSASSEKDLNKLAEENCIGVDKKSKFEKHLAAIKSFGIGRSVLNYTELTAQNITVTGINIEYNPSYYVAVSAGKIDYRFRDFYNKSSKQNNQYIVLGRLGIGNKDRRALIFSYFTGRKSNNNYGYNDSINSSINLMGYSLEAIYKKDENTFLSAEFAKSTKPVIGNIDGTKQANALVKFSDQSNMGINIKGQTLFPETHTRVSGFFRKTGEHFQSFSLFSYNTNQTAWLARVDQALFKENVTITGMLRRNDFTNPFTDKTYKTSTVFKSIQVTARFKKYPSISIGYFPGTQLYIVDKEKIRESAYYILNGSATYSYFVKGIVMNSTLVYNKYNSEATDSGFVPYTGVNYYASQTVRLRKFDLHGGYAFTKQSILSYSTLEASAEYNITRWLLVGTGIKYNLVKDGNRYWGNSVMVKADFKKIGGLQLQYDKSYLPTINGQLAVVEIGRIGYYRKF